MKCPKCGSKLDTGLNCYKCGYLDTKLYADTRHEGGLMNTKTIMEFNKRFANGEQHLYLTASGEIEEIRKDYYWQDREVYNHIAPIVERIKAKTPDITDRKLYGKNGIVERLIPIQRAYNNIKNRRHEYLNRIATGVLIVEDGSVDLDNIEEEGIAPGKVIVYRQGSIQPTLLQQQPLVNEFNSAEDRLLKEFYAIAEIKEQV